MGALTHCIYPFDSFGGLFKQKDFKPQTQQQNDVLECLILFEETLFAHVTSEQKALSAEIMRALLDREIDHIIMTMTAVG